MIDAYRIGVSIAVTSNGDQALGMLMRRLFGIHGAAKMAKDKLDKLKLAAVGALGVFAGTVVLKGIWSTIQAARDLNRELDRTRQLGGEFTAGVDQARLAAFRTADMVRTNTPAENVRVQRELGTQLQNPQAAIDILPMAQRVAYVVSNYTGENQENIVKNLVKVADIRAQIFSKGADGKEHVDSAKVMSEFEAAAHGLIIAGDYLNSNDFVQMARRAGVPAKGMTQEAFYASLVEMAVSQGASRTGTAVTSLFSQLVGGTMPVHTAVEMTRMGLMTSAQWHSDHGHVFIDKAATEKFEGAFKDPIKWITDVLDPILTSRGMNAQQKIGEVFRLFGRQTTERLVAEALSSKPQFARARSMFGSIPNTGDQYNMLMNKDLTANLTAFTAGWTGLMQALGEQGIPMAVGILHGLTDGIHAMTNFLVAHPEMARLMIEFAAALGGLLVLGGGLAVASVAIGGLASALRLLAPAAGAFGAGSAGAAGIGGLIGLLGKLSAVFGAFGAGAELGHYLSHTFDDDGKTKHPIVDPLIKGVLSMLGVDGSRNMPTASDLQERRNLPSFIAPPAPSAAPGSSPANPVHVQGSVVVTNGRDLVGGVSAAQAKAASRPSAGTSAPDPRNSGPYQGLMGAY